MRSGKVVGTDLSGLGRKVFHKDDVVNETNFPIGNYEKLVKSGWIDEGQTEIDRVGASLDDINFDQDKKSNKNKDKK